MGPKRCLCCCCNTKNSSPGAQGTTELRAEAGHRGTLAPGAVNDMPRTRVGQLRCCSCCNALLRPLPPRTGKGCQCELLLLSCCFSCCCCSCCLLSPLLATPKPVASSLAAPEPQHGLLGLQLCDVFPQKPDGESALPSSGSGKASHGWQRKGCTVFAQNGCLRLAYPMVAPKPVTRW